MDLQPIDPHSDRAVYRQIADQLRHAIESGELAPGDPLPSERDLSEAFATARGTIRQAVQQLKSEGLVDSARGRAAFVRERRPVKRLFHDRFARKHRDAGKAAYLAELENEGRTPRVEPLFIGKGKLPTNIAPLLGLKPNAPVLVRSRLYLADDEPMETAISYVPWDLAKGTDMVKENPGPGGIYARIEDLGHRLKRFAEEVTARAPSPDEAQMLQLAPGVPVLSVVRTAYDMDDTPVEVCDTVLAADRYVLSYELPAR